MCIVHLKLSGKHLSINLGVCIIWNNIASEILDTTELLFDIKLSLKLLHIDLTDKILLPVFLWFSYELMPYISKLKKNKKQIKICPTIALLYVMDYSKKTSLKRSLMCYYLIFCRFTVGVTTYQDNLVEKKNQLYLIL